MLVAFIDTAGLNAILLAHRLFEILGLALVVRAPSHPVRRLLGVSRLDGLIEQPKTAVAQMFGPTRPAQQAACWLQRTPACGRRSTPATRMRCIRSG